MPDNKKLNVIIVGEKLDRFSETVKALEDKFNFYLANGDKCFSSICSFKEDLCLILFQKRCIKSYCLHCIKKVKWKFPEVLLCVVCERVTKEVSTLLFKYGVMDIYEKSFKEEIKVDVLVPMFDHLFHMKNNANKLSNNYLILKDFEALPAHNTHRPDERIQRAKNYISKNFNFPVKLEVIADIACISKYHFCKLFKNSEGVSFKEYINGIRIKKAAELLNSSDYSVEKIAYEVGFTSQSYFTGLFKSWTTMSPSQFRNKSF
jgi:AraC-like DNA-binding protein